jgi:hypothetical protein
MARQGTRNARLLVMLFDNPRACFQALAARGHDPYLAGTTGTWEFDLEGDGTWSIEVDDGRLSVTEGSTGRPTTRFRLHAADFVRLANGAEHENLLTSVLRGAMQVDGDIRFASRLQAVLPMPAAQQERTTP